MYAFLICHYALILSWTKITNQRSPECLLYVLWLAYIAGKKPLCSSQTMCHCANVFLHCISTGYSSGTAMPTVEYINSPKPLHLHAGMCIIKST